MATVTGLIGLSGLPMGQWRWLARRGGQLRVASMIRISGDRHYAILRLFNGIERAKNRHEAIPHHRRLIIVDRIAE